MAISFNAIGGLDIGNGYVKAVVSSTNSLQEIDTPSSVAISTRDGSATAKDDVLAVSVISAKNSATSSDFFNELDASFDTPLVADKYRRLFGTRALSAGASGSSMDEFDISSNKSKAEQELSSVLVLGNFAAKALIDYVTIYNELPTEEISINAVAVLALPIAEHHHHRDAYAKKFIDTDHVVIIENFVTKVRVRVHFERVVVLAEGAPAIYAITDKGEPLMNAMLSDVRAHGVVLDGITASDVLAARNTIGVDVGEGTVNFTVFTNSRPNVDASLSMSKGYGTVLTSALESLEARNIPTAFSNRKQLADFLKDEPTPLQRSRYNRVKSIVDEEAEFFANEVAVNFGKMLSNIGANTEVVYVYGGGSGGIKDVLYPKLIEKVVEMLGDKEAIPVMYLDARYSRNLNREGLYLAANVEAKKLANLPV